MEEKKSYTITLDDDPVMHRLISKITGINSLPFACPEKLLGRAESYSPAAVFVDIHLGVGLSGLDFIQRLREVWQYVPILVVTSDPEADLVGMALALGANDFIRKPVDSAELLGRLQARINEMKSRVRNAEQNIFGVTFNNEQKYVQFNERKMYLGAKEAELLRLLSENLGMVVSKANLKARLWGSLSVTENALDKKISSLRASLRDIDSGLKLKSIYGGGVVLERDAETEEAA